jgi:uncharacterized protein YbaP (TraB family)
MKRFFVIFCCVLFYFIPKAQTSKHLYPSVFWEITGNGLKSPGYLFGTMHVSNKLVFHLSDSFYNAIQRCDQVALELNPLHWQPDMVQMDAAQAHMAAYLKNGNNDYITESSFSLNKYDDDLKAALTSQPMQINGLLYRTQAAQADYEENTYLDLYIYQTGRKLGKKPGGVEDYYETEKLVFEAYRDMARDKNKKRPDTDGESEYSIQNKIQDAYRRGDLDLLDSLEGLMFSSPAYVEKFLYRRNEIQANSIDTILKKNPLFVGVGAAHLPGKRGVIELLRKKGYILRPIIMQDRDAARKDSIDKMKVPVAFRQVTTDDGMVTMQAPGALYRKNVAQQQGGADGWQFADMDNGSYYMLTRVQTHAAMLGQTTDEVMKKIDSVLYENIPGKIIKKERITKSGYPGYDITNKTRRGDIQRYNIIATPYEILVFRMSGNDNYVDGSEANTFFNSITIKAPAQGWQAWQSPAGGFSVMLPQQPNVSIDASGSDNINRVEYEAVDKNTGNAYMIWKKTVLNDDFLEEDPFDLSLVEQSFKKSDIISKQVSRGLTRQNGYAALDMQFSLKTGGFINARAILRGTQYYLLAERTSKTSKPDKRFLQSFAFTDAAYPPAEQYTDTLLHFTVNTPVRPQLDARLVNMYSQAMKDDDGTIEGLNRKPYWPRESSALFKSDSTGEAVQVNVKEFPVYYYSKDSAAFWKSRIKLKNDDSDLVLYTKQFITVSPVCKGYKLVYRDTNTVRQITEYVLLSGNRLYRLTAVGDTLQSSNGFIPTFFNSFQPFETKTGPSVFDNKLDTFFADFASKDSLLHQRAANAIPDVYFGPAGISRITKAINSLKYTDKDYFDLKTKFIHELGFIDDTCCIPQTVNALLDVYTKTADTSYFQNEAIAALARLKTSQSWAALKNLLVQDPPVFDNQSDYSTLFSYFYDTLPLAKALFPDILQLSSIEDYKAPVTSLLRTMVDSGFVKAADYEQYYSKLYFDARIQLKKQQNNDEKLLEKENSKEDDDDNNSTANYNYRSLLRGRYRNLDYSNNNSSDIGIGDYAILLSPFYDTHPAVPKFFDRQLQSKDLSVQLDAAIVLLRNHKTVADSILLNIAAKNQYRAKLLKRLEEIHRTELFPAKYRNQDSVARALLLNDKSLPKFNDVACMGKQYVKVNKTEGNVYFYKYKLKKNDEWHLGISGIQPVNTAQVSSNDLLTKMTDKKFKTDTTEAEQFDEQLKKLIFQQHRSALNFFEDNNEYSYLRRKYESE